MLFAAALAFATYVQMPGESLYISLPHAHELVALRGPVRRAIWTEERVVVQVSLDVYDLPGEPLRSIARTDQWTQALRLSLSDTSSHKSIPLTSPRLLQAVRRHSEPPIISLQANYDIGSLRSGDYEITVAAGRSVTPFPFSVRTGNEPEMRDAYLRDKAKAARDYATFRTLELQRLAIDPGNLYVMHQLLERSLNEGTESEIRSDIERAIKANGRPVKTKSDPYLRGLLLARMSVPELLAHRPDWLMYFDGQAGAFVIYSRANHAIVRTLR